MGKGKWVAVGRINGCRKKKEWGGMREKDELVGTRGGVWEGDLPWAYGFYGRGQGEKADGRSIKSGEGSEGGKGPWVLRITGGAGMENPINESAMDKRTVG